MCGRSEGLAPRHVCDCGCDSSLMLIKNLELHEDPNVHVSCFDTFIVKLFTQLDHIFKSLVLDHGIYLKHL